MTHSDTAHLNAYTHTTDSTTFIKVYNASFGGCKFLQNPEL